MIKKKISRTTFQAHLIDFVRDEMYEAAIKDDGIYSTFKYHNRYFATGETRITLCYCKLDCDDKWLPAQRKILYKNCPELGDVTLPCICAESLKTASDRIKIDMVKNDNAIWSTIKVEPFTDHFTVSYEKVYVDGAPSEDPHLITSRYLGASDLEIENTKKTLQRLERLKMNSIYGLYPSTCYFDEKAKEDLKASLKTWKAKAEACDFAAKCLGFADAETLSWISDYYGYGSHNKEEKEKKDMNVTLMVVPNGMNKDFVNRVKANFQSNNSQRLFIASTDIDYSGEYEEYRLLKNKYDLFEDWVKRGKVDIIYFMLGFEKDPDVRAFESFVRGITEFPDNNKVDIRVVYQKNDIQDDIEHLRNAYFDEADAEEDLERAGNRVVREAKVLKEVYSLNNTGLDIIKYSKGKIDASDELVINDIMDTAFASDEDAKPAKKGGKK